MTKKELMEVLEPFEDDAVVICQDEEGGWDNIIEATTNGCTITIKCGGGSPFTDGG